MSCFVIEYINFYIIMWEFCVLLNPTFVLCEAHVVADNSYLFCAPIILIFRNLVGRCN